MPEKIIRLEPHLVKKRYEETMVQYASLIDEANDIRRVEHVSSTEKPGEDLGFYIQHAFSKKFAFKLRESITADLARIGVEPGVADDQTDMDGLMYASYKVQMFSLDVPFIDFDIRKLSRQEREQLTNVQEKLDELIYAKLSINARMKSARDLWDERKGQKEREQVDNVSVSWTLSSSFDQGENVEIGVGGIISNGIAKADSESFGEKMGRIFVFRKPGN